MTFSDQVSRVLRDGVRRRRRLDDAHPRGRLLRAEGGLLHCLRCPRIAIPARKQDYLQVCSSKISLVADFTWHRKLIPIPQVFGSFLGEPSLEAIYRSTAMANFVQISHIRIEVIEASSKSQDVLMHISFSRAFISLHLVIFEPYSNK